MKFVLRPIHQGCQPIHPDAGPVSPRQATESTMPSQLRATAIGSTVHPCLPKPHRAGRRRRDTTPWNRPARLEPDHEGPDSTEQRSKIARQKSMVVDSSSCVPFRDSGFSECSHLRQHLNVRLDESHTKTGASSFAQPEIKIEQGFQSQLLE